MRDQVLWKRLLVFMSLPFVWVCRTIPPGRLELETPEVDRNYRRLLRRVAPEGWKVVGYSRISAPKPARGAIPLLGRVEVVPVR